MRGELGGIRREWLVWYDTVNQPYLLPQELIRQQARQLMQVETQLMQERLEKMQLLERLQQLGVNVDDL